MKTCQSRTIIDCIENAKPKMMIKSKLFLIIFITGFYLFCFGQHITNQKIRKPVDSIGFTVHSQQMDDFITLLTRKWGTKLKSIEDSLAITPNTCWKTIIMPHDDYGYVQYLYPAGIKNLKAKTIFIIGVAHKARLLNIEDKIVFDSYQYWDAAKGRIGVSTIREKIMALLDQSQYMVSDTLHKIEHSIEPFLPFIQYYHGDVQIVPILVPAMPIKQMQETAKQLAGAIYKTAQKEHLQWGKDFAILISNDAIHYGDSDWGGKNYAPYGCDSAGYTKAKQHEYEIINNCLLNGLNIAKVENITKYTVQEQNYKEYKWTWCGRYSVPFGLLASIYLQDLYKIKLKDRFIGYSTSIENTPLDAQHLQLGFTAPANLHHWVGYTCVAYE